MNPGTPPTRPDDPDLSQAEQAYRQLGAEQPPELLDRAVLNRARRAVARRRPWSWNLPWYHTVGTAAGVLLAVGIFLQMRSEAPNVTSPTMELRDEVRPESELGTVSEAMLESEPIDDVSRQRADHPAEADGLALPASGNEPLAAGQREEQFNAKRALAREQPDQETPQAPQVSAATVAGGEGAEEPRAEPGRDADSRFETSADEGAQRLRQVEFKADIREPEAWLEELRRLRETGDEAAFLEQLRAFRAAYPDHPLPEDWPH